MIYLFYGENERAIRTQANKLIAKYQVSTGSDFGLHRFDEDSDPTSIAEAITSVSMFSEASLVVIERPSRSKSLIEHLEPLLRNVPEQTVVLINDPAIDKRTKWFKTLQSLATVKEFKAKTLAQRQKLVESRIKQAGLDIENDARDLLLEYVDDEWRLEQEIEKLIGIRDTIRLEHINDLVRPSPRQTVFTMLEALTSGNTGRALDYYSDIRRQSVHELEVLALIGWQLRVLLLVKEEAGDDNTLIKVHRINPYVVRKAKPVIAGIESQSLQAAYMAVIEADYAIKTTAHSTDSYIEMLLVDIAELLQGSKSKST